MPREWPGSRQRRSDVQIHTGGPDRPYSSYMQRCQERQEDPLDTPILYQTCSHLFLGRWGQPRCQVAGQALPAPSGIRLRAPRPAPRPPTCRLKTGWQMAPGGLRWQKQGSVASSVLWRMGVGAGGGEPPTWRAETGTSRRLQGTGLSWARDSASQGSHGHSMAPQGRASPGWRPRPHRERAGTSCVCAAPANP